MAQELVLSAILVASLAVLIVLAWRIAPGMQLTLGRRPDWRLMNTDCDYFRRSMERLFAGRGYMVRGNWLHHDPLDETPREVLFALERSGTRYVALCVRWAEPVTSDVIARFEQSLPATRANVGMIVTTSIFSEGA